MSLEVRVHEADFDHAQEYEKLARTSQCGAVVTFTGKVRELATEALDAIVIEHYRGMTESVLHEIAQQAQQRWELGSITLIHRVGRLPVNAQIVFVGVASPHRAAAFEAAMFIMDYLKSQAPFWKREDTEQRSTWVKAKASDAHALQRWEQS